jgi:hypothetical protein
MWDDAAVFVPKHMLARTEESYEKPYGSRFG